MNSSKDNHSSESSLALAAVGVVFGDIGTSPLYTLKSCLTAHANLMSGPSAINHLLGILSLIFWALLLVVSCKYVIVVMRADNKGEGGILALTALALRDTHSSRKANILIGLGIFGAALFYGDGIITPAISVLSAFEGVSVISHRLDQYVVPLSVVVLILLFCLQKRGTASVGKLFGPVMVLWFLTLGLLGLVHIVKAPEILVALNPLYGIRFLINNPSIGFVTMGAVVLAVTGGEALYADMGHFGVRAIRKAWFFLALPMLLLNYFGQGALLLTHPSAIKNPFFMLAPSWGLLPLVVLSVVATVIASQAVISGAYSMTNQAIHLGYCPRMSVLHTSDREIGQIYVPGINWFLLIAVILLVILFRTSDNLAAAYGLSVCGTMLMTTLLAFVVLGNRLMSLIQRVLVYIALLGFLLIDLVLFSANMLKVPNGGWFPLVIGTAAFILMMTWRRGRQLLEARLCEDELPLDLFIESLENSPPQRVEGISVFMTANANSAPHALLHNLKHNKILHRIVVFMTIKTADVPYVSSQEQLSLRQLGQSFYQVVATYGFKDEVNISSIQSRVKQLQPELDFDPMRTSYFLSRETIVEAKHPAMSWWRRQLFAVMSRNATRASSYFKIPPNRVVEMGTQVEM